MRYRFGNCELAPSSHELIVDGKPRPVEPQVFDLLHLLVRKSEQLVTYDELLAEIWNGRIVSDSAISARLSAARAAIGDDGTRQEFIKTVARRGVRFVGSVEAVGEVPKPDHSRSEKTEADHQRVKFCNSRDGTRIAYATTGSGQALVKAGHWLTHLDYDWRSPIWRPFLNELNRHMRVTRYDQRGNGLSDWNVEDFSLENFVEDLEAVVDAAGLERFALYGTSQGAAIAIAYACRHPHRVSHLILHGGYQKGRLVRTSASERAEGEAILTLIRYGWGRPGSPFIKAFSSMFIPDGTRQEIDSLAELQKLTTSPENAARLREAVDRFDVSGLLREVTCPTLILHSRDDGVHPMDQGRKLAAGIGGAEFVMLESANHVILQHEPAWSVLFDTMMRFVGSTKDRT